MEKIKIKYDYAKSEFIKAEPHLRIWFKIALQSCHPDNIHKVLAESHSEFQRWLDKYNYEIVN